MREEESRSQGAMNQKGGFRFICCLMGDEKLRGG